MTTPDHRPYLTATDLRTPEDVLAWLIDYPSTDAAQASIDLHERLDRERRQACRRGALAVFREACRERERERDAQRLFDDDRAAKTYRMFRLHHLRRALAFRAAARA